MSQRLHNLNAQLSEVASQRDGFIPFDEFMHMALYTPNLGYYTSTLPVGSPSQGGDFTTAPQLSSLFGTTLAQAIAPLFEAGLAVNILEFGAGTGKLAVDVLSRLQSLGIAVESYKIIEVSTRLRHQQTETLLGFSCIEWLDALPVDFEGVVIGNELLDAMPVKAYEVQQHGGNPVVFERGVTPANPEQNLSWQWAMQRTSKKQALNVLTLIDEESAQQDSYQLEICEQSNAWITSVASILRRGLVLLVDYGFPREELYHPQRMGGTLMAHYQHQASSNVLTHVGEADITAHVDFTAVAQAGQEAGMDLLGYTSQARFLINAGIAQAYEASAKNQDEIGLAKLSRGLQYLISEAEMGELFKVIALGKNCPAPKGFESGDRSHRLNHA